MFKWCFISYSCERECIPNDSFPFHVSDSFRLESETCLAMVTLYESFSKKVGFPNCNFSKNKVFTI